MDESHLDQLQSALSVFPNPPRLELTPRGIAVEGVGLCGTLRTEYVLYHDGRRDHANHFSTVVRWVVDILLEQANELKGSPE